MKHFIKYAVPCLLLSLACLLAACQGQTEPTLSPVPFDEVSEVPTLESEPVPSPETLSPAPEHSPAPAPVSLSYLSVVSTTPSGLDGTVSEAAELPGNIIQSLALPCCEVYLYLQPTGEDGASTVYAQVRSAGWQYDWLLSNRYFSGGYELIPLEGLFGFDAFAVKQSVFYYYYRAWDGMDDHYPELLFYREGSPSLCDADADGQPELLIPQGYDNRYTLALLSAGGDICRLSFRSDQAVKDWTGLLADDPFLQTLKAMERVSLTDHVQLAPPEGYALSISESQNTIQLLSEESSEAVGSISRQSSPTTPPASNRARFILKYVLPPVPGHRLFHPGGSHRTGPQRPVCRERLSRPLILTPGVPRRAFPSTIGLHLSHILVDKRKPLCYA